MAIPEHRLQQVGGFLQDSAIGRGERADVPGERRDASRASRLEHPASSGGGVNALDAPVGRVEAPGDEAIRFQAGHEAGDGGWPYLLGVGEVAEADRAGEDDDGEGGEGRGAEAGRLVVDPEAAQEVDGGRVQAVGDRLGVGGRPADAGACAFGR